MAMYNFFEYRQFISEPGRCPDVVAMGFDCTSNKVITHNSLLINF